MRNKILVLVLALVCLLSVSALAKDVKPELDAAVKTAIENATSKHEFHTYGGDNYYSESQKLYVVEYNLPTHTKAGNISLLCVDEDCAAKHDGAWTSKSGQTTGNLVEFELAAVGHDKDKLLESKAPTCTEDGYQKWFCAACNTKWEMKAKDYPELQMTNHVGETYTIESDTATCQEYAYTAKKCDKCNTVYDKVYDYRSGKKQCSWKDSTPVVVSIATCTQEGLTQVTSACEWCGRSNPSKPVVNTVTDKIVHNKDDQYGLKNVVKGIVDYTVTKEVNAAGIAYVKINKNVESFMVPGETTDVDKDGNTLALHGPYTFTHTPATCTEDGSVVIACVNCGTSIEYATKATNHEDRDYAQMERPDWKDCTVAYKDAYRCKDCDKYFEELSSTYAAHKYVKETDHFIQYQNNGLWKVEFNWFDGYHDVNGDWHGIYGYRINDGEWIEAADAAPVACLPYTKVFDCQNADYCRVKKLAEVPATVNAEHQKPAKDKFYKYEEADCSKSGLAMYECTACHDIITEILPQTEKHSVLTWSIDTPATCKAPGAASAVCQICKQPQTMVIPALTHKLEEVERIPAGTCSNGLLVKACKNCGEKAETVIPAQHNPGTRTEAEYDYYKDSTCTTPGSKKFTCATCGVNVTVEIAKKPHKMVLDVNSYTSATCCTPAFYKKTCEAKNCTAYEIVYVGNALGHNKVWNGTAYVALDKAFIAGVRDAALAGTLDTTKYTVKGNLSCTTGATATMLCKAPYTLYTLKADGTYKVEPKTCSYEATFVIPADDHVWSDPTYNKETNAFIVICEVCGETKTTEFVKPEYAIDINGTKGVVTLKNTQATPLAEAWVRISYGFKLSDGSEIAMITCMPITFNEDRTEGTFSFFAMNTALESTGINYMVVDQYDAMSKTIGQLVGHNYGMYIS